MTSQDDLQRSLGRLEGKLDIVIENHDKRLDAHAKDIGALKRWRNYMVGPGAVIMSVQRSEMTRRSPHRPRPRYSRPNRA